MYFTQNKSREIGGDVMRLIRWKIYVAFLGVLGSIWWLASMVILQSVQSDLSAPLSTPHSRFLFLVPYVVFVLGGLFSLGYLFLKWVAFELLNGVSHGGEE